MGTSLAPSEHCDLLAERKILDDQARPRAEGRQQRADERLSNRIHVGDSPPDLSSVSPQNRTVLWATLTNGRLRPFASQSARNPVFGHHKGLESLPIYRLFTRKWD